MPQSRSGGFEEHNFLMLPEIEPRTVQLIAKSLHGLGSVLYVPSTPLLTVTLYCVMGLLLKLEYFMLHIFAFTTF
jgi:hypothetical protein